MMDKPLTAIKNALMVAASTMLLVAAGAALFLSGHYAVDFYTMGQAHPMLNNHPVKISDTACLK